MKLINDRNGKNHPREKCEVVVAVIGMHDAARWGSSLYSLPYCWPQFSRCRIVVIIVPLHFPLSWWVPLHPRPRIVTLNAATPRCRPLLISPWWWWWLLVAPAPHLSQLVVIGSSSPSPSPSPSCRCSPFPPREQLLTAVWVLWCCGAVVVVVAVVIIVVVA
jgi:hypothetical protein